MYEVYKEPQIVQSRTFATKPAQELQLGDRFTVGSEVVTVSAPPQIASNGNIYVMINGGSLPFANLMPYEIVNTIVGE